MTRKSPFRHPVKQHLREGKVVHHYERGKGKAPKPPIGEHTLSGSRWRVTRAGHSVTVAGGDIVSGLSRGIDVLPAAGESVTVQRV